LTEPGAEMDAERHSFDPSGSMPVVFVGSSRLQSRFRDLASRIDIQALKTSRRVGFHRGGIVVVIELDYLASCCIDELIQAGEILSWGAVQAMGYVVPFCNASGPGQAKLRKEIRQNIEQNDVKDSSRAQKLSELMSQLVRYQCPPWEEDEFEDRIVAAVRRASGYIRHYQWIAFINAIIGWVDSIPRTFFIFWPFLGWLVTLVTVWWSPSTLFPMMIGTQAASLAYPVRNLLRVNYLGWVLSDRKGHRQGLATLLVLNSIVLAIVGHNHVTVLCVGLSLGLVLHAVWELWAHSRERYSHAESLIPLLAQEEGRRDYTPLSPHAESIRITSFSDESASSKLLRMMRHKTRWGMFRDASPTIWHNVFISHRCLHHGNTIALAIYDGLKRRGLMSPWVDLCDLNEGKWDFDISTAFARTGTFVVVLTREKEDIASGDWAHKMGFVAGELELAFNLSVQYGQPEILIVECGANVDELNLPEELRNNIDRGKIPRLVCNIPQNGSKLPQEVDTRQIVEAIEATLYRKTPTGIVSRGFTSLLSLGYFALWLSRLVTIPMLLALVFGWRTELQAWQQCIFILSLFSGSITTTLSDVVQRASMNSARVLHHMGKPISAFGARYYVVAWLAAVVFIWNLWDFERQPLLQVTLCAALWLNLNASLLMPTIWNAERQKHASPRESEYTVGNKSRDDFSGSRMPL